MTTSVALFVVAAAAASLRPGPPPGITPPPPATVPDHSLAQSALVVRGEAIATVDLDVHHPKFTPEFVEYTNSRFVGWPAPQAAGMWDFHLVRFEITEVLNATDGLRLQPGAIIDIYLSSGVGMSSRGSPYDQSPEHIVFLEHYVHREGGNVSPYSAKGNAFVVSHASHGVLQATPEDDVCPGKAQTTGGRYILDLVTSEAELHALRNDPRLSQRDFSVLAVGEPTMTRSNTFDESPWSCEDLVAYSQVADSVRVASKVHADP